MTKTKIIRDRFPKIPISDDDEIRFLTQWMHSKVIMEEYELAQLIKNQVDYLKFKRQS